MIIDLAGTVLLLAAAGKARFDRLHRLSVLFTVLILIMGIGVVALVSAGRPLGA